LTTLPQPATLSIESTLNEQETHLKVPVMKGCKSFFKLYHLQPFITGTSTCSNAEQFCF